MLSQGSFKAVSRNCQMVFLGDFKGVSSMFQKVTRVFQESLKGGGSFKVVSKSSKVFEVRFK